jgi:hypothetical protein
MAVGDSGFHPSRHATTFLNQGGGPGGGFLDSLKNFGNFLGGKGGQGFLDLGSLALNTYGLDKSLGFAEDQLGILKDQEDRAATAQNLQTGNQLSLALQTTTPGTPEHERIKQAISQGQFQV